ncbi:MAG TPA: rRNA adenine N-6-methyltransferase family protein [Planctomycetota bacterium]|jgi:phospholipid N-methyltransferase|nr:rRNA adenine N-6-methyltransferase family protein [Planctomycetota bacterium]
MEGTDPDGRAGNGLFMFRQFFRDPRIAAVKSTSPYLVRRICRRLNLGERRVVVELGPGMGCFSRALLDRLSPDATLLLIETNPDFADVLGRIHEPRLRVVRGSAVHLKEILHGSGQSRADVVLSGIPFSYYSEDAKMQLLGDIREVLAEGGVFLAYQSSAHLEKYLKRVFPRVRVERQVFHIPPLVVLEARAA